MSMCDSSMTFADYIRDFAFVKAGVCPYANEVGFALLGLVVWAAVGISLFIRTGSFALPAIVTVLIGAAVLAQIAAPGMAFVTVLLLGMIGAIAVGLYIKLA